MSPTTRFQIGPILILDALTPEDMHLAALFVLDKGRSPPPLETPAGPAIAAPLAEYDHATVWRARFTLPADRPAQYLWAGDRYEVSGDFRTDLRLAYVSCNGEEHGDLDRDGTERNGMWARLCAQHRTRPFSLLLHGGDQLYADEVTQAHPLSQDWPRIAPDTPSEGAISELRHALREGFFERYATLYAAPEFAWLAARVPSLTQWDDHDICDGWGSLPETLGRSAVGQALFSAARESCLLFQHAATDGDLPERFADPKGRHLGWSVCGPDLRILAPDLRSERTPERVMGPQGWAMIQAEAAKRAPGRTLLMSSVPLLGPRLSLLERALVAMPQLQKYEDDLRDQWQSYAHRAEWRRMLQAVQEIAQIEAQEVTALSGEIHLAARAEMPLSPAKSLTQLVASGIAHRPPPKAWAGFLGTLARLGEDPLPGHRIAIKPLPGQRNRYVAERNYLMLERQAGAWSARWDLEESGVTEPISL